MKLFNTLSRRLEPFEPQGDVVKMYVCGITPYAPSHLGHALRGVVFDVLRRFLEYRGYKVKHVENFTDIDDKMIQGAAEEGISTSELANQNIKTYLEEMDRLNLLRAQVYPRATEEIRRICQMIEVLIGKGLAYTVGGDVYFRVRNAPRYGKLSRRNLEEMRAGARVEIDRRKEDSMDFALWKSQKPGEPAWESPWGNGRPGWHIECSAMIEEYLGTPIDIHGGGRELTFPHHENEIAQTEGYRTGKPLAHLWIHNGLLAMGEDKMSKSLGNIVAVADALTKYSTDAIRLFFLSSHYRSPLNYSEEAIVAQERGAERLRNAATLGSNPGLPTGFDPRGFKNRFEAAMDDDLNTPKALAVLFDMVRGINRAREEKVNTSEAQLVLKNLASVLGLRLEEGVGTTREDFARLMQRLPEIRAKLDGEHLIGLTALLDNALTDHGIDINQWNLPNAVTILPDDADITSVAFDLIDALVTIRGQLRVSQRYDLADYVRDKLTDDGIVLEDTAEGTSWKRVSCPTS